MSDRITSPFQRYSTARIEGLRVFDVRLSKGVLPPSAVAHAGLL